MWVQERGGCFHLAWDTSHLELDFQVRAVKCLDLQLVTDAPAGTFLGAGTQGQPCPCVLWLSSPLRTGRFPPPSPPQVPPACPLHLLSESCPVPGGAGWCGEQ